MKSFSLVFALCAVIVFVQSSPLPQDVPSSQSIVEEASSAIESAGKTIVNEAPLAIESAGKTIVNETPLAIESAGKTIVDEVPLAIESAGKTIVDGTSSAIDSVSKTAEETFSSGAASADEGLKNLEKIAAGNIEFEGRAEKAGKFFDNAAKTVISGITSVADKFAGVIKSPFA